MRIITGTAKGTRLTTLDGEDVRPTAERVKEGIFSAIQFDIHDRRVLDLFGGSGQLSLEALSRGAASAVIIDLSRSAVETIKTNAIRTKLIEKCRISVADWKQYLKGVKGREKFDLVFLDPPYKDGFIDEVLKVICIADILNEGAIIVCESKKEGVPIPLDGFEQKLYKYGKTYISIIRN